MYFPVKHACLYNKINSVPLVSVLKTFDYICVLLDAPEFAKHPGDIVQIEGGGVVFNCSVEGNPQPSIKWRKNNKILNTEANSKLTTSSSANTHSLRIQDVHRSDEGQYRCVANNNIGNITSTAGTLKVLCE